ncbi:protein jim lovell isoform X2 [Nilaparvata lugens]|nr:protein jim lovell isoform X2 [Nilaparvata lugens]XP_039298499.1 protein jim lovell isoform X2 [Nilaparvata lugens]XP_039298500.1 protein jim lovell isoform X2 [Nilaparvata lugens]
MECSPDLSFLTMAAAGVTNTDFAELASKLASAANNHEMFPFAMRPSVMIKQRKTNFTPREVEVLLAAVDKRRDIVLFGTAGGQVWAKAWQEVAQEVTAVEGIYRTESDVRKKWTYLKWEAKNTSKPGRDPTSRAVLEILTGGDPDAAATIGAKSLLEELLVLGQVAGSPQQAALQNQEVTNSSPQVPKIQLPLHVQRPQTPLLPVSGPTSPSTASVKKQHSPSTSPAVYTTEVCLRWNSYHSNMQTVFPSLLNNEQFVDVTLACEGQSIKCHKMMLSACSNYFEELLSQNPCQHPIVLMKDLRFWELQALVDFMYRGEVNVTQDRLPSLLAAAEALQIKGLAGPASSSQPQANTAGNGSENCSQDESANPKRIYRKRRISSRSCLVMPKTPTSTQVSPVQSHTDQSVYGSFTPSPNVYSNKHRKLDDPPKLEKDTRKDYSSANEKVTWKLQPIKETFPTRSILKKDILGMSRTKETNGTELREFPSSMAESENNTKKRAENRMLSQESCEDEYYENETECDTENDENRSLSSNGSANLMIDEGQNDQPTPETTISQ